MTPSLNLGDLFFVATKKVGGELLIVNLYDEETAAEYVNDGWNVRVAKVVAGPTIEP